MPVEICFIFDRQFALAVRETRTSRLQKTLNLTSSYLAPGEYELTVLFFTIDNQTKKASPIKFTIKDGETSVIDLGKHMQL